MPLRLHDDGVDFACWCSYKYLNSGPGALAGCFVHAKHDTTRMRGALRGWWGNERRTRFQMRQAPDYRPGAPGLQLSNPPTLPMVALKEAYALHDEATMARLRAKSLLLTGYLEVLLFARLPPESHAVVTPRDPACRGAQLSLLFKPPTDVDAVFGALRARNVFVDLRRPNVIRVAPAPLYNSFADVKAFVDCLEDALRDTAREAAKPLPMDVSACATPKAAKDALRAILAAPAAAAAFRAALEAARAEEPLDFFYAVAAYRAAPSRAAASQIYDRYVAPAGDAFVDVAGAAQRAVAKRLAADDAAPDVDLFDACVESVLSLLARVRLRPFLEANAAARFPPAAASPTVAAAPDLALAALP